MTTHDYESQLWSQCIRLKDNKSDSLLNLLKDLRSTERADVQQTCKLADEIVASKWDSISNFILDFDTKDILSKAQEQKSKGNKAFERKQYEQAATEYTLGLLYTAIVLSDNNHDSNGFNEIHRKQGRELASVLYNNRATCLFHMNLFLQAAADAIKAVEYNPLYAKAYHRRGCCLVELGFKDQGRKDIQFSTDLAARGGSNANKEDHISTAASNHNQKLEATITRVLSQIEAEATDSNRQGTVPSLPTEGSYEVRVTEKQGRHLVAKKDFVAGETIICEEPYAGVLRKEYALTNCHHCFRRCLALMPSYTGTICDSGLYCSQSCIAKSKAFSAPWSPRKQQPPAFAFLEDCPLDLSLALKTVTRIRTSTNNGNDNDARSLIESLVSHEDSMSQDVIAVMALNAAILIRLLPFPPEFTPTVYSLVNTMCKIACNCIATVELKVSKETNTVSQCRVAKCLYARTSLMNHSCTPSCHLQFEHARRVLVKATSSISKGSELTISYGPQYPKMDKATRQQVLKEQYFFACECDACTSGKDTSVADSTNERQAQSLFSAARSYIDMYNQRAERGLLEKALGCMQKCLSLREQQQQQQRDQQSNSRDALMKLAKTHDSLAEILCIKEDFESASLHLTSSIKLLEGIFGPQSPELGLEYEKLAGIYFNIDMRRGRPTKRTKEAIMKAIQLLPSSYEGTMELRKMLDMLNSR